jgi:phenylacetate-CoA ligase
MGWRESGIEWFMRLAGVPEGSRVAYLWGHHLDPVASERFTDRLRDFAHNVEWLDCFRLSTEKLGSYHQRLQRRSPVCVVAYAKALADLASVARELDRPRYPKRCLITGAEKLLAEHRTVIEETYKRPVHERYGSRDVGLIGFQIDAACSLDFTIDWSSVMVEPETDDVRSPILVTKLRADGMPMLRYRIGDVARFSPASHPGHPCLSLSEVLGRETDRIWLPGGGWIDGIEFPHLMKDHPIRDFRVIQRRDFSVVVEYVAADSFSREDYREIFDTLAANMRGLRLTLREVADIPRPDSLKWRPVHTELGRSGLADRGNVERS